MFYDIFFLYIGIVKPFSTNALNDYYNSSCSYVDLLYILYAFYPFAFEEMNSSKTIHKFILFQCEHGVMVMR